jgi:hypothetical protein
MKRTQNEKILQIKFETCLCQAIVGNLFIFPIVRIYQCSNGLYLTLFTAFIPRSP